MFSYETERRHLEHERHMIISDIDLSPTFKFFEEFANMYGTPIEQF